LVTTNLLTCFLKNDEKRMKGSECWEGRCEFWLLLTRIARLTGDRTKAGRSSPVTITSKVSTTEITTYRLGVFFTRPKTKEDDDVQPEQIYEK
jgi:hypothetical protein